LVMVVCFVFVEDRDVTTRDCAKHQISKNSRSSNCKEEIR
jgi:hypothetical protein